jgi:hypothetical protein
MAENPTKTSDEILSELFSSIAPPKKPETEDGEVDDHKSAASSPSESEHKSSKKVKKAKKEKKKKKKKEKKKSISSPLQRKSRPLSPPAAAPSERIIRKAPDLRSESGSRHHRGSDNFDNYRDQNRHVAHDVGHGDRDRHVGHDVGHGDRDDRHGHHGQGSEKRQQNYNRESEYKSSSNTRDHDRYQNYNQQKNDGGRLSREHQKRYSRQEERPPKRSSSSHEDQFWDTTWEAMEVQKKADALVSIYYISLKSYIQGVP